MSERSHLKREIELHEKIAEDYRLRYGYPFSLFYNRYWNHILIKLLPQKKGLRILDLGCGTGFFLEDISKCHANTVGLDLSEAMLAIGKEKPGVGRFVAGDGSNLPFISESFDVIVCRGSLHHMPNLEATLSEIYRVLVPEGRVIITEPSNDAWLIRLSRKLMYHISDNFDEEDEGYHLSDLERRFEKSGFNSKIVRRFGFLGYVFSGFPDRLGILKHVPGSLSITKVFIWIDQIVEKTPVLKHLCFQIMGSFEKR
jgi:ubiquinone/menaquinone biosynthesis C-methylase UbiE